MLYTADLSLRDLSDEV